MALFPLQGPYRAPPPNPVGGGPRGAPLYASSSQLSPPTVRGSAGFGFRLALAWLVSLTLFGLNLVHLGNQVRVAVILNGLFDAVADKKDTQVDFLLQQFVNQFSIDIKKIVDNICNIYSVI